jgi:hypothetical protein
VTAYAKLAWYLALLVIVAAALWATGALREPAQ